MADRTTPTRDAGATPTDEPAGDRWVATERRLDAPPNRVYRAWADPEELPRWLPYGLEGGLAVGTRSILVWPDRRTWWEVVEATADRKIVLRHPTRLDETLITTTTVTIRPSGMGSRLRLRDGPFPAGRAGGLDAWAAALEAWTEAVILLRAYLDFSVDLRPRR